MLTLAHALKVARAQQPALRAARANTMFAEADVDLARAPMLPQITGTASLTRQTGNYVPRPGAVPQKNVSPPSPSWDLYTFYQFGAQGNQLIYDFGLSGKKLSAKKEDARAAHEDERAAGLSVDAQLRTAYFVAQATRALVSVAQAALDNQEKHLSQIQAFVEVGTRPSIDLAQARADMANARVLMIQSENNYQLARVRLNQAMGVEEGIDYDVDEGDFAERPEELLSEEQLLTQAYQTRPELLAIERRVRARELSAVSARGGYGPSVGLTSSLTKGSTRLDTLGWNFSGGVAMTWPLLQGGQTYAQAREADAVAAVTRAQRDTLRQGVRVAVEQARLGVVGAKAVLVASDEAVSAARERLSLAEGRYEAGVGNIIELADAQLALTQAESQRVQAQYGLSTARAALMQAVGSVD